jgi:5-formyltetrahydrofolate cyclo-ligase
VAEQAGGQNAADDLPYARRERRAHHHAARLIDPERANKRIWEISVNNEVDTTATAARAAPAAARLRLTACSF